MFDENGKFLDMWPLRSPTGRPISTLMVNHLITEDQFLWVADGGTSRILKYDLNGNYLYGWGGPGGQPGQFNGPHSISTDQEGNLYLAEFFGGRVQKFRRSPEPIPARWWARSSGTPWRTEPRARKTNETVSARCA